MFLRLVWYPNYFTEKIEYVDVDTLPEQYVSLPLQIPFNRHFLILEPDMLNPSSQ